MTGPKYVYVVKGWLGCIGALKAFYDKERAKNYAKKVLKRKSPELFREEEFEEDVLIARYWIDAEGINYPESSLSVIRVKVEDWNKRNEAV